jgi:hypothetical protein
MISAVRRACNNDLSFGARYFIKQTLKDCDLVKMAQGRRNSNTWRGSMIAHQLGVETLIRVLDWRIFESSPGGMGAELEGTSGDYCLSRSDE